jgi:hypothetical protein
MGKTPNHIQKGVSVVNSADQSESAPVPFRHEIDERAGEQVQVPFSVVPACKEPDIQIRTQSGKGRRYIPRKPVSDYP